MKKKTGRFIVIKVDGTVESRELNQEATLDEVREALGGWVEPVPFWKEYQGESAQAYVDEEGKLKGLSLNQKANALWQHQYHSADYLVGNVVVLTGAAKWR